MAKGKAITGRTSQLAELTAAVGLPTEDDGIPSHHMLHEPAPPLVVVYGGVSTGKSLCVRHMLTASAAHFALVDCTGVMTTRAFYHEILGQLQNNARGRRPRRESSAAESVASSEIGDADVVTITDAPPAAIANGEMEEKKSVDGSEDRRSRRRRRNEDEERKDNDISSSDAEVEAIRPGSSGVEKTDEPKPSTEEFVHASLNFLSFVKALRLHMNGALPPDPPRGAKPTVYIALDHIETLLDRGFDKLVTCLLAVNDQLDYLHIFDPHGAPWRLCVILIARAVSVDLDLFLHGAHPAFVHFPAYTKEEVAAIVTQNLLGAADLSVALDDNRERAAWLRKWLVSIYDLLPHCHNDWLEFQHVVVQLLPSFHAFFDLVSVEDHARLPQLGDGTTAATDSTTDGTKHSWRQLQNASGDRIKALEKSRRRHLFGYDNVASYSVTNTSETVPVSSGDPVAFIASSKLSRSCLLLLVAAYLASFTPHEADTHFVSISGGVRRKHRIHRASGERGGANGAPGDTNGTSGGQGKKTTSATAARKALNQQLIGPKIFELPRLLAIYLSLQIESDAMMDEVAASNDLRETEREETPRNWPVQYGDRSTRTRADIFTHLALLVRLRLLQRASPPSDLDQPLFRCIADTRLVQEIARRLQFPLESYLNIRG